MSEFNEEALQAYPLANITPPLNWKLVALEDVSADVRPGFASGNHNSDGTGLPHLRPMNVDRDGQINLNVVKSVAGSNGIELRAGDVLFNNTNSAELVGKTAAVSVRESGFAFSNHMTRIRLESGVNSIFAARQLHFLWMTGYTRHRCTNHVNQASVSSKTLAKSIPFLLPPTTEQTRIVDRLEGLLSDLDAGVAELKAAHKKLALYRQLILQAAVEGALTADWRAQHPAAETGVQLLARILADRRSRWEAGQLAKFKEQGKPAPPGWQKKYLEPKVLTTSKFTNLLPGEWCEATTALAGTVLLGRQRAPQYLTGRFPRKYLRVANIKDNWIDFSDIESMDFDEVHFEKYQLSPGDILVSEGQSPELVGQSAIFLGHQEPLCFQKTLHRFRALPGVALPEYAQLVFRSHVYTGLFRAIASITTNIAHLTLEKFEAAPFPLPPVAEQAEIVAIADFQLGRIAAMKRDIEKGLAQSNAQRQNILRAAFAGRLVPQDRTDEPASVLLARIRAERAARESAGKRSRAAAGGALNLAVARP